MNYPKGRLVAVMVLALSAALWSFAGSAVPSRASGPTPATTPLSSLVPGAPWVDSGGHLIQGHNGSVILDNSPSLPQPTYYWIGQDLTSDRTAAACYQSTDLEHWTPDGDILSVAPPGSGPNGTNPPGGGLPKPSSGTYLIGTTKVMYDSTTSQYVLWAGVSIKPSDGSMNLQVPDNRPDSDFLLDVAETGSGQPPCSSYGQSASYTWQHAAGPWQPFGRPVGDFGVFQDSIGGKTYSYLIDADQGWSCSSGGNCFEPSSTFQYEPDTSNACGANNTDCLTGPELRVYLITPDPPQSGETGAGDISFQGTVLNLIGNFEAPAMFNTGSSGPTFLLASQKSSWAPNENQYNYTTKAPPTTGPYSGTAWSGWQSWSDVNPADENANTDTVTCQSQTFFVLPVQGTSQTTYIYMGDRWDSSNIQDGAGDSLGDSGYVWLPLQVSASPPNLRLNCLNNWSINSTTGVANTTLSDPAFTVTNVGNGMVLDGTADGTLTADQPTTPLLKSQKWELIVDPNIEGPPSYTPEYELQNVATGQAISVPCENTPHGCDILLNPLDQEGFGGLTRQTWQFVSVTGGPNLTLANGFGDGSMDAGQDGSVDSNAATSPPPESQQWALNETG